MKTLVLYGIIILMMSCKTQLTVVEVKNYKIGIKNNHIRGTIFKKGYSYNLEFAFIEDSVNRWTPTLDDIKLAEKILSENIKTVNKSRPNQVNHCPVIHRQLNKYFRQYVGVINDKGEKLIHINFSWDRYNLIDRIRGNFDTRLSYDSNYNVVLDGCSYYWQITVNLEEKKLVNLMVNGFA